MSAIFREVSWRISFRVAARESLSCFTDSAAYPLSLKLIACKDRKAKASVIKMTHPAPPEVHLTVSESLSAKH